MKGATFARLLTGYLLLRRLTAALGLTSIAGHAQSRAPAGRADGRGGSRSARRGDARGGQGASRRDDNVGLFFGEDVFIAIGSILLMKGFMAQQGIELAPFELSVWAIPTALFAFAIHAFRLWRFERRRLRR